MCQLVRLKCTKFNSWLLLVCLFVCLFGSYVEFNTVYACVVSFGSNCSIQRYNHTKATVNKITKKKIKLI